MLSLMPDTRFLTAVEHAPRSMRVGSRGATGTAVHIMERVMRWRKIVELVVSILR
jgi:hypothetical protein